MVRRESDGGERRRLPVMQTPLAAVLGASTAAALAAKLDLHTQGDLLRHYPKRYRKRGELTNLGDLVEDQPVTVWARVADVKSREVYKNGRKLHVLTLVISDGRHAVDCTFFNQRYLARAFPIATEGVFSGTVKRFRNTFQLRSPQAEKLDDSLDDEGRKIASVEAFAGGILPIYPLADTISMAMLQRCLKTVLDNMDVIPDPLPEVLLAKHGLVDLTEALKSIHRPDTDGQREHAEIRLRYDEALAMQLVLAQRRARVKYFPAEPCPVIDGGLLSTFDGRLPFTLTAGQRQVGATIERDLSTIHPMNRLLQGEVGSGKTIVALRAMLQVIDAGRQAVLLAPTEVLAAQHARSLASMLGPLAIAGELGAPDLSTRVTLLTGSLPAGARRKVLLDIASGSAGIVVGTHALLGPSVIFADLGLVVVDEQHRFGVEQRNLLRSKNPATNPPHVLVMTATPIPRTVAMTVFGDLETSTLRELPAGRSPISSTVVPAAEKPAWLDRAWQRVHEEVAKGRQVYIVCPRIGGDGDETDELDGEPAADIGERRPPLPVIETAVMLADGPLAGLRLGVLHGRLGATEKDSVMLEFKAGELDVLVATTVIEVGVDVPNATMMIVLDAERFGLSQLHQLRGRVGRGSAPGICLLVTESSPHSVSMARLKVVAGTNDGFEVARADLEMRREGDVLGRIQAGKSSSLKLLSLLKHEQTIVDARADAIGLVDDDPELQRWPGLREMVGYVLDEQSQQFLEKS